MTVQPVAIVVALAVAACGGGSRSSAAARSRRGSASGGAATTTATATSRATISFVGHLDRRRAEELPGRHRRFKKQYPNVKVKYTPAGDNAADRPRDGGRGRQSAGHRGGRPARADQASSRARARSSRSTIARATIDAELLARAGSKLGTINGKLYGFVFKAANKSTVWYNVTAFKNAGVEAAEDVGRAAHGRARRCRRRASRRTRSAARDGWTLTDLFENIYLRQAGRTSTTSCPTHEIKWTDPSVKAALKTMAQDRRRHARTSPAARPARCRPTSRRRSRRCSATRRRPRWCSRATSSPASSVVDEGEAGTGLQRLRRSRRSTARAGRRRRRRRRDHVQGHARRPGVRQVPGDAARRRRSGPRRAASRRRTRSVDAERLPGRDHARDATALAEAKTFRFDMSDLAPAAFGGTPGQGEWKDLQDFLKNPNERQRHRHAARGGRGEGVRPSQVSAGGIDRGSRRRRRLRDAAAARARSAGAGCSPRAFLAPAAVFLLRLDRLPDDLHDLPELLRPQRRPSSSASTTTRQLFTTDTLRRRSRTTRSGSRSCRRWSPRSA